MADSDERLELVLSEALRALTEQQAVLDHLRSRATVLLSAAALVGALMGAPLLSDGVRPGALTQLAIVALAGTLLLTLLITAPLFRWRFTPKVSALLQAVGDGHDLDSMRRHLALDLERFKQGNGRILARLQWMFSGAAVLLTAEFGLLLSALFTR
ncbi:hypothetical protein [Actinoplanes aureus]|uniref:Uncharacterized protein n=1 Tax=Actinoplanes aureus TaxID=2792083 RepID=A0A931CFX1_9ACTN|nr:hypothetical protein [Actinoplanes aureus]MBG0565368.1 hypothetical protein [Actinoplanes aureus]